MFKNATLRQLAAFHAVARLGSVSRAASELSLTQPAVSIQLKLLEESAGAPLLQRAGRGIRLTPAGDLMAGYAQRYGFSFAPHAKTSMAPTLLDAQFAAGAWAMTVATPNQALVLRRLGVPRVLIANEVLDPTALRWLAGEWAAGWDVLVQVDSVAGVEAVAAAGGLPVLVELGHPGGRTGCRTVEEVVTVARAAAAAPGITLRGVTGYEGALPDVAAVDAFLDSITDVLRGGGEVSFTGFGKFHTTHRAARMGVNPRNPSEKVQIRAATVPKFSAGSVLKKAVN